MRIILMMSWGELWNVWGVSDFVVSVPDRFIRKNTSCDCEQTVYIREIFVLTLDQFEHGNLLLFHLMHYVIESRCHILILLVITL